MRDMARGGISICFVEHGGSMDLLRRIQQNGNLLPRHEWQPSRERFPRKGIIGAHNNSSLEENKCFLQ